MTHQYQILNKRYGIDIGVVLQPFHSSLSKESIMTERVPWKESNLALSKS